MKTMKPGVMKLAKKMGMQVGGVSMGGNRVAKGAAKLPTKLPMAGPGKLSSVTKIGSRPKLGKFKSAMKGGRLKNY